MRSGAPALQQRARPPQLRPDVAKEVNILKKFLAEIKIYSVSLYTI